MSFEEWPTYLNHLRELEAAGLITRTFRRLDPQRQKAVLDAILGDAVEKGPASVRIKEIAARAGVSVGSLYQYFPDRDHLIDFAVELGKRYFYDLFDLSEPYLLAMPLEEALKSYLQYGVEWGQSEASLVHFFGRAAYQGDARLTKTLVEPVAERMRALLERLLVQAVARGELRPDCDVPATARLLHVLTLGLGDSQLLPYLDAYFQVGAQEMPFSRIMQALMDLLRSGLLVNHMEGRDHA